MISAVRPQMEAQKAIEALGEISLVTGRQFPQGAFVSCQKAGQVKKSACVRLIGEGRSSRMAPVGPSVILSSEFVKVMKFGFVRMFINHCERK